MSPLLWGPWMPPVVGLLEKRELAARRRVDELREEADRIRAELIVAELEWKEWTVARSRVGEVMAPTVETGQGHAPAVPAPSGATAAKAKSRVPMWSEGWPSRCCRWTTSASSPFSRTSTVSAKAP
ncbi:hypothetical protein GCM10018966_069100 [Streptomyces yanii]